MFAASCFRQRLLTAVASAGLGGLPVWHIRHHYTDASGNNVSELLSLFTEGGHDCAAGYQNSVSAANV